MMHSFRLRLLLSAWGASLLLACGGGSDTPPVAPPTPTPPTPPPAPAPPPAVTGIALTPSTVAFESITGVDTVVATLEPAGATGTVTWRSANSAIATVSGSGNSAIITAIAPGSTQVIAAVGSIEGSVAVIVPAIPQEIEQTVPTTGGTITLDIPGHPFEGLALTIPSGSFDGSTVWRVSTDSAPARSFPGGATVMGPGLAIDGVAGRTRGGQMLTMRVPVSSQTDNVVVVALVDPVTNDFDLLPLIDRDSASVTVMTRHLDARLFRSGAAGARAAASASRFSSQQTIDPSLLYRIELSPEALRSVSSRLNPARHAWPVPEDGSAQFPCGHGSAIPALMMAAVERDLDLQSLVRRRSGWFYADTAPFATVMLTSILQKQHESAMNAIRSIGRSTATSEGAYAQLAPQSKAVRDKLMATNLAAGMLLTGRPQLFLKLPASADIGDPCQRAWGMAVSTDADGNFSFLNPAANQLSSFLKLTLGANGFDDVQSKSLASDASATVRDEIIAVPPALMDVSAAQTLLARMEQAMRAEGGQRQSLNRSLWSETNSPAVDVQARRTSAADYVTVAGPLVVFDTAASLKLAVNEPAQTLMSFYAPGGGAEVLSVSATETVAVDRLPGVQGAAEGETVTVEGVVVDHATGRQVVPLRLSVTRGSFALTKDTVEINDDASVEMTAALTPPPADGFVVHWDWGDGTSDAIPGLTSATHTYAESGDYTVVATLRGSSDTTALAADTAEVIEPPGVWVGSVSGSRFVAEVGPSEGIVRWQATNVRWVFDPTWTAEPGWRSYKVVSGILSYWNEVPCAGWTSPTLQENLASGPMRGSFLRVGKPSAQESGGSGAARLYYGQAFMEAPRRLTNRLCSGPSDDYEYVFSGPPIFFQAHPLGSANPPKQSTSDPSLLEGSYTQTVNGLTSSWSWRFERVPR